LEAKKHFTKFFIEKGKMLSYGFWELSATPPTAAKKTSTGLILSSQGRQFVPNSIYPGLQGHGHWILIMDKKAKRK